MKKRLIAMGASALIAGGALVALPTAAQAGSPYHCTIFGQVCIYDNINYGTLLGWRWIGFGAENVSTVNNDRMSSWENYSNGTGRWYWDADQRGPCRTMWRRSENPWVRDYDNDKLTSWAGDGGC